MNKIHVFINHLKNIPSGVFLLGMTIICVIWSHSWGTFFWGNYPFIPKEELLSEILGEPIIALEEEFTWRLLPFTIVSILWFVGMRLKISSMLLGFIMVTLIIAIQIKFGLAHIVWNSHQRQMLHLSIHPNLTEKIEYIIIHGGVGLILAFVYFKFLLHNNTYKFFKYIQVLPLIASALVHMLNNQIIDYLNVY